MLVWISWKMSDCKVRKVTCDFVFLRERPNVCIAVFRLVHTGTIIARVYRLHLMPCDQTKGANVSVHTDAQNGVFFNTYGLFFGLPRCVKNWETNEIADFVHMPGPAEVTVKQDLVALKHKTILPSTYWMHVRSIKLHSTTMCAGVCLF